MLDIGIGNLMNRVDAVKPEKKPDTYQSLMKELSLYERTFVRLPVDVGTEGFGDAMYATWTGMVDILIRLGNNFKTNVFKSYMNLKRSEIRYYSESNVMQIHGVESLGIHQVSKAQVPIPSGMQATYKDAVDSITQVYQTLNADTTLGDVKQCFSNIYRSLSLEDNRHKDYLKQFNNVTRDYIERVGMAIAQCDKIFTELQTNKVPFTSAYKTMEEFRQVRQQLLNMEKFLQSTTHLEKEHDNIVAAVENISLVLNKESTVIDKDFLTELAGVIRLTATMFEAYGINAQRQCAMEHNHIEVIRSIWSNVMMHQKVSGTEGMTEATIEAKVKKIISEQLVIDISKIHSTSVLKDLGVDKLDAVEIAMALEEEFSISIPDEDAIRLTTVEAIVKHVAKLYRKGSTEALSTEAQNTQNLV